MRYLHTMVRVKDLDQALHFYCKLFRAPRDSPVRERERPLHARLSRCPPGDVDRAKDEAAPCLELTYNWDPEEYAGGRNFGHLAYEVDDIYAFCKHLMDNGVTINRPPRDGHMAFVRSPDGISIEILQKGEHLAAQEPWASMANTGVW
ncbi:VOC family protein [Sinorhizobium meliloti]|nr:VOC family protein [Sinorhizobium meliloti]